VVSNAAYGGVRSGQRRHGAAHPRNQARQQRVACDVERHSQAEVAAALVHRARELAVRHVELAEHVARRQRHEAEVGGVPRGKHDAAVVGGVLDLVDDVGELVDALHARPLIAAAA
jgi:hypothetical protein